MSFDFQAHYAELNPVDDDYRFYADLALSRSPGTAVDLGCGTGTLARLLARAGIAVVAVDPDPAMVRAARSAPDRDGSAKVEWRQGYSDVLEPESADFAVMSGHVAQVFVEEASWEETLRDLHRALRPGGTLAFESRNPAARAWEGWTRSATLRTVPTPDGDVEFWHETHSVQLPLVVYDTHALNVRTGHQTVDRDTLAFRSEALLRQSVEAAGFVVETVFGDWASGPTSPWSPELIVVARRA